MRIFGLHITTAKTATRQRAEHECLAKKNAKDNSLWNKVIGKLLWENHHMRLALRR